MYELIDRFLHLGGGPHLPEVPHFYENRSLVGEEKILSLGSQSVSQSIGRDQFFGSNSVGQGISREGRQLWTEGYQSDKLIFRVWSHQTKGYFFK